MEIIVYQILFLITGSFQALLTLTVAVLAIDILIYFWGGAWTLWFNLKTNKYHDRFLDAYGRDKIDESLLKVIAAAEVFG